MTQAGRRGWVVALLALAVLGSVLAYTLLNRPGDATPATSPSTAPSGSVAVVTAAPSTSVTPTSTPSPTRVATPRPTPTPDPLAPPVDQVLRVYCCATDPRSLRPQAASGSDEISVISAIQRGLLYLDADLNVVPMMATDLPEVSDDGTVYTFHLGDWSYSDGTPVVAADFVRAARSLADPRMAFDYGYEMCWVAGVDEVLGEDFGCSEGDTPYADREAGTFDDATIDALLHNIGVAAPDDRTVVFTLKQPVVFWNSIVATWLLTPVPESQGSWAEATDILASGPFMIESWRHNSAITLVPNPHWNGEAPTLQRIEIGIGGDPAAALAAFERGDLDLVSVPPADVPRVLASPTLSALASRRPTLSLEYYDFATCQSKDPTGQLLCPENSAVTKGVIGGSPTQNIHFRWALTQAIDKADMIRAAFGGLGTPAYSPTMPGIPGFPSVTEDTTPLPYDPAAALEQMAIALGELGVAEPRPGSVLPVSASCDEACQHTKAWVKMLGPLKFGFSCDSGHDVRVLYMANAWILTLGFSTSQMDIRCTDGWGDWFGGPPRNIYDIHRNGWGADFVHPDNQNRDLFKCGSQNNDSVYCNPAYDALLDRGVAATSYEEALPFYQQAERTLVQDAPVLFLRYGEGLRLVRPWILDLVATAADHQNVGDMFYERIKIAAH
jgi:oligopeptide transport system substrate-binding protein